MNIKFLFNEIDINRHTLLVEKNIILTSPFNCDK